MMLLLDAGNSRVKFRSWDGRKFGPLRHLADSAQSLAAFAQGQALVSCVARPSVREQSQQQLQTQHIKAHWLQSPAQGLGLRNAYAQPEKLGVDRYLALAAAYAQSNDACCVIDAGTAITVDIVDANGQHQGGLIAPGLGALNQALRSGTALPLIDTRPLTPDSPFADNTDNALRAGAWHSACGLVERSCRLAKQRFGCELVLLTGGDAKLLQPQLQQTVQLDADLVFKGLALYAQDGDTDALDSL